MCGWKDVGIVIRKNIVCGVVSTLFGCSLGFHPCCCIIYNASSVTCFAVFWGREKYR